MEKEKPDRLHYVRNQLVFLLPLLCMLMLWDFPFSAYHGHLTSLKPLSTYKLGSGVSQRPDPRVSIVSVMRKKGRESLM